MQDIDSLTERFDTAFHITMNNLGPRLIIHAQLGLTPSQVFLLYSIRKDTQCTVSELAKKMDVKPSAVTVMLDRLENHGFVTRTRDTNDRRVVTVQVTEAGEEELNKVLSLRKQAVQQCLTQLEQNELENFIKNLEKLAQYSANITFGTTEKGESI